MLVPPPWNKYPYAENYSFSIERQMGAATLLSLSYVGSQAHHLLVDYSANPGNPALCLALSQPGAVAPGSPRCGPFGEDTQYVKASGQIVNGTRQGQGPAYGNGSYNASIGNSNYNSFQDTVASAAIAGFFYAQYYADPQHRRDLIGCYATSRNSPQPSDFEESVAIHRNIYAHR